MPGTIAEADGAVQPFAGQIDAVVVRQQAQIHEGVGVLEAAQAWQQPAHGKCAHNPHGQHFARAHVGHARQRLLHTHEALRQHRNELHALVRQRQAAGQAPEEGLSQAVFEVADVLAHGCLRHVQLLCGAREVQIPRSRLEGAQGVQRKMHGVKFFLGLAAIIVDGQVPGASVSFSPFPT